MKTELLKQVVGQKLSAASQQAACRFCGGWSTFGGMSQHRDSSVPVHGRLGCDFSHVLAARVVAIENGIKGVTDATPWSSSLTAQQKAEKSRASRRLNVILKETGVSREDAMAVVAPSLY